MGSRPLRYDTVDTGTSGPMSANLRVWDFVGAHTSSPRCSCTFGVGESASRPRESPPADVRSGYESARAFGCRHTVTRWRHVSRRFRKPG